MKIALISMPWLSPYRPSIQLGVLQAYLHQEMPELQVDAFHEHLGVAAWMDYDKVKLVADGVLSAWLGESLSSYLLFPERRPVCSRFLDFLVQGKEPRVDIAQDLLRPYARYLRERVEALPWEDYDLVGLSVSLCQTLSSVLMARRIRARSRRPRIVIGGPAVSSRMGRSFLDAFPEIDAVVNGEGEQPLCLLVQRLGEGRDLTGLKGVMTRTSAPEGDMEHLELPSLEPLPFVDYDAYFATLDTLGCRDDVLRDLEVPVEGSRGCWWDRRHCRQGASCQFCNLNLQWDRYREKPVEHQLSEMQHLLDRHAGHGVHRFLLVDNVVRKKQTDVVALFEGIRDRIPEEPEIYMEARANLRPRLWRLLREAGVTHCQVGIESLSTSMLRKINKGTTTIMNLEAMKSMERFGIQNPANIIYDLPFMTCSEVDEIIDVIRYAHAYHPLSPTRFFLNYGSPYYERFFLRDQPELQIENRNYRAWQVLLPPDLEPMVFLSEREFEIEVPGMAEAVARLEQACREWREHYWGARERGVGCLLRQGPDPEREGALLIEDQRGDEPLFHLLTDLAARVYTFFETRRSLSACLESMPDCTPEKIEDLVRDLVDKRLMFREGRELLALAIPAE